MKCLLEEIEALEYNFSDIFSPNRSDSIRSTFMGENSTIAPSQLAYELKKQKETLIAEFSDVMSDSVQETKDMLRINEQNSTVYSTSNDLPSFIPNEPTQSQTDSANTSASTTTAQASNETPLFLPN